MGIIMTDSAKEHGFTKPDAIHAMETPLAYERYFGEPREGYRLPPAAWIGPAMGGRTIEVFANIIGGRDNTIEVFHCMDLRENVRLAMIAAGHQL